MRAVQIDRHGGPEVLQVREVPDSTLRPGGVLIRAVASSINPVDWKTRTWDRGPAFPMTLGWDLAGIVVDSDVAAFRTGDRVIAMSAQLATGIGTWTDMVALPAGTVAHAPRRIGLVESAALPLAGTTAVQALRRLQVEPGQRLLVTGALGGVGSLAVQLVRSAGATVDALVSRPEHVDGARGLGSGQVFHDVGALPPRAYDAVFDTASIDPGPALLAGGGYVSITDDPLPPIAGAEQPQVKEDGATLEHLVDLVDRGCLHVRIAQYHSVTNVQEAHRRFEAGGLGGKVILLF